MMNKVATAGNVEAATQRGQAEIYVETTESEVMHAFAKSRTPQGREFVAYHYWFGKEAGLLGRRILFKIDLSPDKKDSNV